MAFAKSSLKYKPIRAGILVAEGEFDDLTKAAAINCILWGGAFNPIIPVSANNLKDVESMIESTSIDILYQISESNEIDSIIKKHKFLSMPGFLGDSLLIKNHQEKYRSSLLDITNMMGLLWEKRYKNEDTGFNSPYILPTWSADDPLSNLFALQFGRFPTHIEMEIDFVACFSKYLLARDLAIPIDEPISDLFVNSSPPVKATRNLIRNYSNTGMRSHVHAFFMGRSDSFNDLVSFWNLRTQFLELEFFPLDQIERYLPFAQNHLDNLNTNLNSHRHSSKNLIVNYRMENEDDSKSSLSILNSERQLSGMRALGFYGSSPARNQAYQYFQDQTISTHIEPASGKYQVQFDLPSKKFLLEENHGDRNYQHLGALLNVYGEFDYPGYTLTPPNLFSLTDFYSREMALGPDHIRVSEEGITYLIPAFEDSITLYPISRRLLVEKIFLLSGITASTSQPGRILNRLIDQIGKLDDGRVFKIPGVRMILQKGSPETAITRSHAKNLIFTSKFDKFLSLHIEQREKRNLDPDAVFDFLLKKNLLRAGLELKCSHCHLENWSPLKDLDDNWDCEFCGGSNLTSIELRNRGDWKFRKSGLFAKDNNQEGAIPVLLTLLSLKTIFGHGERFTYTTALNLRGTGIPTCETDFCVIRENQSGSIIELGIGECKSDGGQVTEDDCRNLSSVAKHAQSTNHRLKAYLFFTKTSDSFTESELERLIELNKTIPVVILTNHELEPYHMYWEDEERASKVPNRYPQSFSDLHKNSVALYLAKPAKPGSQD